MKITLTEINDGTNKTFKLEANKPFPKDWVLFSVDKKDNHKHFSGWLVATCPIVDYSRIESHDEKGTTYKKSNVTFKVRLDKNVTTWLLKFKNRPIELKLLHDQSSAELKKISLLSLPRPIGMVYAAALEAKRLLLNSAYRTTTIHDCKENYRARKLRGVLSLLKHQILNRVTCFQNDYALWTRLYSSITPQIREKIFSQQKLFKSEPKISVVMPVYETDERWLRKAIESVQKQTYHNWELCIADDGSKNPKVKEVLEYFRQNDPRIRVTYRQESGHISQASNSALALCTGEFTALLDHDDELSEDAFFWVVKEINNNPDLNLIYSDEDKIDIFGNRFEPHFKPNWSHDLLYSLNLVTHLAVYKTSLIKKIGGFRTGFEGSQDYDLVLRVFENSKLEQIKHIPRILYHWRAIPTSTAKNPDAKSYAIDAARMAISEHLKRRGVNASVEPGYGSWHRVRYALPNPAPLVSVIICTRDKVELLKGIVSGLLQKTDYPNMEIIVIDNQSKQKATLTYLDKIRKDSRVKVLSFDEPFNFSKINNYGVQQANGEILAFLNNDLLVINETWLSEMVSHACRSEVGAVGARLLYPNGSVQHAGVVLGVGGIAGHAYKYLRRDSSGYIGGAKIIRNYSAVTGACLVTRKNIFIKVGGFEENELAIAFNDIDLCLKIRSLGLLITYTPYAELYHLESASRGYDITKEKRARLKKEGSFMTEKWGTLLNEDPYYSPNLTLNAENYSIAFPPRVDLDLKI